MPNRSALAEPIALGAPVQIAYAVTDVDVAAGRWSEQFGAGPFFVRRHIDVSEATLHGKATVFDHSSAYGQWGSIMVELVQDHGAGPSVFEGWGSGVHHLAFTPSDLTATEAALAAAGLHVVMTARSTQTRFVFVDATATLGHYIELYQASPRLEAFYGAIRAAADGWSGAHPVREIDELAAIRGD